MKKNIRALISRTPVFFQILIARATLFVEGGVQTLRCFYLRRSGMKEFSLKPSPSHYKECHILASGWSLNDSLHLIERSSAFVIGFNFSFLKCPDPDLHFIENASGADERFFINTLQHYAALKLFKLSNHSRLIFKNISEFKNSVKFISWLYGDKAEFIRDRHYRIFSKPGLRPTLKLMLKDKKHLPQAVSSVVGLVIMARIMGFKKIVVHGVDFYGPHFYGRDLGKAIFDGPLPESIDISLDHHKTSTGQNGVGVLDVLVEIKREFEQQGLTLLAATKKSPSAEFLGSNYD